MTRIWSIAKFKAAQIKHQVKTKGADYPVLRFGVNEYGERGTEPEQEFTIRAIFHTRKVFVDRPADDATTNRATGLTTEIPMLLMAYEDYIVNPVTHMDIVNVNGTVFEVQATVNIAELNASMSISLREVNEQWPTSMEP